MLGKDFLDFWLVLIFVNVVFLELVVVGGGKIDVFLYKLNYRGYGGRDKGVFLCVLVVI